MRSTPPPPPPPPSTLRRCAGLVVAGGRLLVVGSLLRSLPLLLLLLLLPLLPLSSSEWGGGLTSSETLAISSSSSSSSSSSCCCGFRGQESLSVLFFSFAFCFFSLPSLFLPSLCGRAFDSRFRLCHSEVRAVAWRLRVCAPNEQRARAASHVGFQTPEPHG